ncbi:MAG: serine/threonine protein phosphatase [Rhodospirillales bacterium]|nr:serine/threonine protein phosphatase [Rhodospirillales bacterium]
MEGSVSRLKGVLARWRESPVAPPATGPHLPSGIVIYAVGDIHGEARLLASMLRHIEADAQPALDAGLKCRLVFLGDYIDRGPDSRGVIELLLAMPPSGFSLTCLMGNHEAALLAFLKDPAAGPPWLSFGGVETLLSYGLPDGARGIRDPACLRALRDALAERLPEAHRDFLAGLPPFLEQGDYAFVHAGVVPGRPLNRQRADDLMWIREPFLSSPDWHGHMIVHGHSIVKTPQFHWNRIAVDTGAYASGVLSGVVLVGGEARPIQVGTSL